MAERREPKGKQEQPVLEWAAAFIGAMIALGILAFIGLEALQSRDGKPPILEVRADKVVTGRGQHIVQVTVANRSGMTAAAVRIEGKLERAGQKVETSTATLGYVPGHSEQEAGLIFSEDPRHHTIQLRATGYEKP